MFSRACEYAFQAVIYITLHGAESRSIGLKEISEAQGSPIAFLSKVLQKLVKGSILSSSKGPSGGYALKVAPDRLTLLEIVKVIDGLDVFERCGIGLDHCSDVAPCPIHDEFKEVKFRIRRLLESNSVMELASDVKEGKFTLSSFRPRGY